MRRNGYRGEARSVRTRTRLCLARTEDNRYCTRERDHEGKCSANG